MGQSASRATEAKDPSCSQRRCHRDSCATRRPASMHESSPRETSAQPAPDRPVPPGDRRPASIGATTPVAHRAAATAPRAATRASDQASNQGLAYRRNCRTREPPHRGASSRPDCHTPCRAIAAPHVRMHPLRLARPCASAIHRSNAQFGAPPACEALREIESRSRHGRGPSPPTRGTRGTRRAAVPKRSGMSVARARPRAIAAAAARFEWPPHPPTRGTHSSRSGSMRRLPEQHQTPAPVARWRAVLIQAGPLGRALLRPAADTSPDRPVKGPQAAPPTSQHAPRLLEWLPALAAPAIDSARPKQARRAIPGWSTCAS